ncbi:hypothetical protein C8J56DRAFT_1158966 [Mycena floridula]|nr:hypothetical protein C8J56DRAFT_1158966 [Mycena floridula]
MSSTLWAIVTLFFGAVYVSAFGFTSISAPSECDSLTIDFAGGTPPFLLLLTPKFGTPRNISIPSSAINDNKGSYTLTNLPFKANSLFLLTLSDVTGFGSGGSTTLLTVAPSLGGTCNTTDPGVSFQYQLNSALQQCRDFVFSEYSDAVQPVTIMGVIPGGQSFVLNPPKGTTSYNWTTDVFNGTSLIFIMTDALFRQGGSSDLYTVVSSDDTSCINKNSPSSTIGPSSTSSPSQTSNPSVSASSTSTPSGTPVGAIAGTVMGALIFLAVTITLGLFYLRKRRDQQSSWENTGFRRNSHRVRSQVDLVRDDNSTPYHYPLPGNNVASNSALPFLPPFSHSDSGHFMQEHTSYSTQSLSDPFNPPPEPDPFTAPMSPESSILAAQRKANIAGVSSYKPSRFILHTDIEDMVPPETEEVVELPPQYTERRKGPS